MSSDLSLRLDGLLKRLYIAYDGIGHSSGRPYIYFVYPPEEERALCQGVRAILRDNQTLRFHHVDLLPLTIAAIDNQEQKRQDLLASPRGTEAGIQIFQVWARAVRQKLSQLLAAVTDGRRPVIVLGGLAALHPLGTPTALMEILAEQELRDRQSQRMVPFVVLVPGVRPPQTSREYLFLGQEYLRCTLYRGEEW